MEGVVQIVILVCLFIIIVLLAIDKVKIVKPEKRQEPKPVLSELPDIMGKINKDIENHRLLEDKSLDMLMNTKTAKIHQPKKNIKNLLDPAHASEVATDPIEDEDLPEDEYPPYDDRFSQGVSLEELMNVGKLLQQSDLQSAQENEVLDVMQKIQGTELYGVLENSIGDASKRVAALLDKNLKSDEPADFDPGDSFDKFNINDFI